jgi:hypothetical protein
MMRRALLASSAAAAASSPSLSSAALLLRRSFSGGAGGPRLRSLDQAEREGTATGKPLRSPDAPKDPAERAAEQNAAAANTNSAAHGNDGDHADSARRERDERIAHAGGGFGPAIIAQNLAEREGKKRTTMATKHRVDPTKTPPGIDVPSGPLPHIFTEQLPHAARKLKKRFSEAVEYMMKGEMGGEVAGELRRAKPSSATRHGAAVEVAGDAEAVAEETKTQGMPPLGEADDLHKRLAEEMRRKEGM